MWSTLEHNFEMQIYSCIYIKMSWQDSCENGVSEVKVEMVVILPFQLVTENPF